MRTVEDLACLSARRLSDMGLGPTARDEIARALKKWSSAQHVADIARPKGARILADELGLDRALLVDHTYIDALGLDVRTRRALIRYGISTVALLSALTLSELRQVAEITPASVERIRIALTNYCRAKGGVSRKAHPLSSASAGPAAKQAAEEPRTVPRGPADDRGEIWRSKLAEWLAAQPEHDGGATRENARREAPCAHRNKTKRGSAKPATDAKASPKPPVRRSQGAGSSMETRRRSSRRSAASTARGSASSSSREQRRLEGASTARNGRVEPRIRSRAPRLASEKEAKPRRKPSQAVLSATEESGLAGGKVGELVALWLERLDARRRHIVAMYYGLGCDRQTMREIGRDLGVTAARIQQLIGEARVELAAVLQLPAGAGHLEALRRFLFDRGGLASEEEIRRGLHRYVSLGDLDPVTGCRILAGVDESLIWLRGPRLLAHRRNPVDKIDTIRSGVRTCASGQVELLSLNHVLFLFCESRVYREECGKPGEEFVLACLRTDPEVDVCEGAIRWVH